MALLAGPGLTPPETFLQTDRLVLRRLTMGDVEHLVDLDSDREVMLFITGGSATTRQEIEEEHLPVYLGQYERYRGYGFWAAIDRSDDGFLGWFHLRPDDGAPEDEPELGYRLRRAVWGRGLATEGSRALIDHAFGESGARRVVAHTMAAHSGSRRVMEKSGMRLVRTFHADWPHKIPGDELGDVEYAITRKEWQAQVGRR